MKLIENRQQILLGLKGKKKGDLTETKETKGEVCLHLFAQANMRSVVLSRI